LPAIQETSMTTKSTFPATPTKIKILKIMYNKFKTFKNHVKNFRLAFSLLPQRSAL
jgi:hypothetical protein